MASSRHGQGGALVWTAQAQSVEPTAVNGVSKEMCGVIVPEMAKAGIIPSKR